MSCKGPQHLGRFKVPYLQSPSGGSSAYLLFTNREPDTIHWGRMPTKGLQKNQNWITDNFSILVVQGFREETRNAFNVHSKGTRINFRHNDDVKSYIHLSLNRQSINKAQQTGGTIIHNNINPISECDCDYWMDQKCPPIQVNISYKVKGKAHQCIGTFHFFEANKYPSLFGL